LVFISSTSLHVYEPSYQTVFLNGSHLPQTGTITEQDSGFGGQASPEVSTAAEPPAKKQRFSVYTGETFLRFILNPKCKIYQTRNNFLFFYFFKWKLNKKSWINCLHLQGKEVKSVKCPSMFASVILSCFSTTNS
jgi:hypothetical protein